MTESGTNWDRIREVGPEGVNRVLQEMPFHKFLGASLEEIRPGYALLQHRPRKDLLNIYKSLHGGVICSLADTAMGLALWTKTRPGQTSMTLEMKINFISQVDEGTETLTAEGQVIHLGKTTGVVEGSLVKEDGTLAARALATFFIMPVKKQPPG